MLCVTEAPVLLLPFQVLILALNCQHVSYRVHCEGGMSSPGVVSSWEAVLFIQSVGQTAFCRKTNAYIQDGVKTATNTRPL